MINYRCVLKAGHMPGWNISCIVVVPYLTIVFHLVVANSVVLSATIGMYRA